MKLTHFAAQKIFPRSEPMILGEPGAKRSQGEKPLPQHGLSRTTSVDYDPWSHLSLRGRCGIEVSATRPLLSGLSSALLVTARPFGLGCRYDEAPSGNGALPEGNHSRARRFEPTRESPDSLAQKFGGFKRDTDGSREADETAKTGSARRATAGAEGIAQNNLSH